MAAATPLAAIVWLSAETAASQVLPSVVDLVGMQSAMVADLQELIKNATYIASVLPTGTNKTTLQTLVTTLS